MTPVSGNSLLAVEHLALGGRCGFDQRDLFVDLYALADGADFHFGVEGEELLGADDDAFLFELLEAGRFHDNLVGGGIDGGEGVLAHGGAVSLPNHVASEELRRMNSL